jgi:hypothetical protein
VRPHGGQACPDVRSSFLTIATGESLLYAASEYADWLAAAGFRQMSRRRLTHDHGVMIGRK